MLVRKTLEPVSTRFRFNDLTAVYNDIKLNWIVSCVYVATYNDLSLNNVSSISDVWIVRSKWIGKQFIGLTLSSHYHCFIFIRKKWINYFELTADIERCVVQLKWITKTYGCTLSTQWAIICFNVVSWCHNSNSSWYCFAVWARCLQRKGCIWRSNRSNTMLLRWCWVNHCYYCLVDWNVIKWTWIILCVIRDPWFTIEGWILSINLPVIFIIFATLEWIITYSIVVCWANLKETINLQICIIAIYICLNICLLEYISDQSYSIIFTKFEIVS